MEFSVRAFLALRFTLSAGVGSLNFRVESALLNHASPG